MPCRLQMTCCLVHIPHQLTTCKNDGVHMGRCTEHVTSRHSRFLLSLAETQLKALQVAARLAAEGWSMTIRDLFRYSTIQELCGHITPLASQADQGPAEGEAELTPIQRRFFGQDHAFTIITTSPSCFSVTKDSMLTRFV